jgi:hypothetical protein
VPYDPRAKLLTPEELEAALAGEEDDLAERRRRHLPTGLPNGRPKAHIDIAVVEGAASIGCTTGEIATVLGIARQTLFDRLKTDPELQEAMQRGCEQGRTTLRRLQWKQAHAGNTTMLIWLGKQLLGQRDKLEAQGAINSDIRVVVELVGEKPTPPPVREIEGERSPVVPAVPWERN